MITKELGKIKSVEFGFGGYQECMLGLHLTFSFSGSAEVCTSVLGGWYEGIQHTESCKWTEEDRTNQRSDMCKQIDNTLSDAKVRYVSELKGKPVELTFDNSYLTSWRILTEVL